MVWCALLAHPDLVEHTLCGSRAHPDRSAGPHPGPRFTSEIGLTLYNLTDVTAGSFRSSRWFHSTWPDTNRELLLPVHGGRQIYIPGGEHLVALTCAKPCQGLVTAGEGHFSTVQLMTPSSRFTVGCGGLRVASNFEGRLQLLRWRAPDAGSPVIDMNLTAAYGKHLAFLRAPTAHFVLANASITWLPPSDTAAPPSPALWLLTIAIVTDLLSIAAAVVLCRSDRRRDLWHRFAIWLLVTPAFVFMLATPTSAFREHRHEWFAMLETAALPGERMLLVVMLALPAVAVATLSLALLRPRLLLSRPVLCRLHHVDLIALVAWVALTLCWHGARLARFHGLVIDDWSSWRHVFLSFGLSAVCNMQLILVPVAKGSPVLTLLGKPSERLLAFHRVLGTATVSCTQLHPNPSPNAPAPTSAPSLVLTPPRSCARSALYGCTAAAFCSRGAAPNVACSQSSSTGQITASPSSRDLSLHVRWPCLASQPSPLSVGARSRPLPTRTVRRLRWPYAALRCTGMASCGTRCLALCSISPTMPRSSWPPNSRSIPNP